MTGLRERLRRVLLDTPDVSEWLDLAQIGRLSADLSAVLGDQDTHDLIQRILTAHDWQMRSGGVVFCAETCGWVGRGLPAHRAHQAAAVVAALTEEQT